MCKIGVVLGVKICFLFALIFILEVARVCAWDVFRGKAPIGEPSLRFLRNFVIVFKWIKLLVVFIIKQFLVLELFVNCQKLLFPKIVIPIMAVKISLLVFKHFLGKRFLLF